MMYQILFSGEIKETHIVNSSTAELVQGVVKVKVPLWNDIR